MHKRTTSKRKAVHAVYGILEASYPSSTTMLVMCVMPTAVMQFNVRINNRTVRRTVAVLIAVFTAFVVIGRLVSGVHWFTDIVGGALFSSGIVMIYRFACGMDKNQKSRRKA